MRQAARVGLIALILVGGARTSEAGIGDLIWELSGPQMVGAGVACRFSFKGIFQYCEWAAGVAGLTFNAAPNENPRWFWTLGGAGYVSTGKNSRYKDNRSCPTAAACAGDEIDYHDFDHRMLSFEPTLDYLVSGGMDAGLFLTAGPTFHAVWNRDAPRFQKTGIKIAPELRFKSVTFSYNLRFYPDGFGPDEFGKGVFAGGDRPSEWTQGFGVSFPFRHR
jgi:hypothetical protein